MAFHRYLRDYCHLSISWTGNRPAPPRKLPRVTQPLRVISPYRYRFLFNYCTFDYTMAFWDWPRWEREIDWMAVHGVNLSLAIVGQEAVWQQTLRRMGYRDAEILAFLSGPAFTAWWLMGNLEGWGGPVTQTWIDAQRLLQQKILRRLRELDISPVLQGFYGMVPHSFAAKFPRANIHNPGTWGRFRRPGMLLPTDSLFPKIAAIYYAEQMRLYGAANFFQGDPFHEGGDPSGVDLPAAGRGIYAAMDKASPGAVWVLQCWQENPRQAMIDSLPRGHVLVTNIMAEAKPQWGGITKYMPARPGGFGPHDWIWSEIPNFGGRTGITGKLDSTALDIIAALHDPRFGATMKGVGMAPEATGQDEVLYDLLYDLAWTDTLPDVTRWLKVYVRNRYQRADGHLDATWALLRNTVYASRYGRRDPPIESIVCARPAWHKNSASSWGEGHIDYDTAALENAWEQALAASPGLTSNAAYRHDLVNLTRQVLANRAKNLYAAMGAAYDSGSVASFRQLSRAFLQLIGDEDRLLRSQPEFLLGPWLAMARSRGASSAEKDWLETNARTLITTWTDTLDSVNDYSCREWSGLLTGYYLPRWRIFIRHSLEQLKARQTGHTLPAVTDSVYFDLETRWAHGHQPYPVRPQGDPIRLSRELFQKYRSSSKQSLPCLNHSNPPVLHAAADAGSSPDSSSASSW
jgi:alpha-N-acetylglucosaminidase